MTKTSHSCGRHVQCAAVVRFRSTSVPCAIRVRPDLCALAFYPCECRSCRVLCLAGLPQGRYQQAEKVLGACLGANPKHAPVIQHRRDARYRPSSIAPRWHLCIPVPTTRYHGRLPYRPLLVGSPLPTRIDRSGSSEDAIVIACEVMPRLA